MGIPKDKIFLAISKRKKIEIDYVDSEGTKTKRILHPHHVFKWNRRIYFLAYCEYDQDIRNFRTSRVKRFQILKDSFKEKIPSFTYYKSNGNFNVFEKRYHVRRLVPDGEADKVKIEGNVECPLPPPKNVYKSEVAFTKSKAQAKSFQGEDDYPIIYSGAKLCNKPAYCRSPIEEEILNQLEDDPNVKRYWIEPIRIPFVACNESHSYTPDVLIEYRTTVNRLLIEVKSLAEINLAENIHKYRIAQNYCYGQANLDFQIWTIENGSIRKLSFQEVLNLKHEKNNSLGSDSVEGNNLWKRMVDFLLRVVT